MTFCFLKAMTQAKTAGGLSQEQYIQHLTAHLKGVRHPEDNVPAISKTLQSLDPWAGSLRDTSLSATYQPLQDTSDYEAFFLACQKGDLARGPELLDKLRREGNGPDPLQPGACLAAQNLRHKLLRAYIGQGAEFDGYLTQAGRIGAQTTEMMQVLWDADWASVRTDTDARSSMSKVLGEGSFGAGWLRDRGEEQVVHNENEGRDAPRGTDSGDPRQGYSPEQLQEWFGDVPW